MRRKMSRRKKKELESLIEFVIICAAGTIAALKLVILFLMRQFNTRTIQMSMSLAIVVLVSIRIYIYYNKYKKNRSRKKDIKPFLYNGFMLFVYLSSFLLGT